MQRKSIVLFIGILISRGNSWYPDYTVMVTDFVLPYDYLAPNRIPSIGLQALGSSFWNIYQSPVDNVFQNPAYLGMNPKHYVYLDVAGEEYQPDDILAYPPYPGYYASVMDYPYYWSPYRYAAEPKAEEPLARAIYFNSPLGKRFPLGMGISMEYFYNREKFYQPYWYWWGWMRNDALGVAYAEEASDPYEDYREVETGDNVQTERGYRINTFLSYPLSSRLLLGLRYGLQSKQAEGDYRDMDFRDQSDWADDYLSYNDRMKRRTQDYSQNDFSGGVLINTGGQSQLGVSLGYTWGQINRGYLETDTTKYYSYYFYGPDTNNYRRYQRSGASSSDKSWAYDGHTLYGTIHGDLAVNADVTLRFSIYSEARVADLTESETMWRRSNHLSRGWYDWDSTLYRYENISNASLDRTGSGEYRYERRRLSFGTDWNLAPHIRFIGGLVVDQKKDQKDADEPFIGNKYSYYYHLYRDDETEEERIHEDNKRFMWYRKETYFTVAVPTGVVVDVGENFSFRIGLTKIMKSTDIEEGYDLVVYHDKNVKIIDGVTVASEDSNYVEGHSFPGTHIFLDEYRMNAGISFKYKEVFKITGAFTESILEPRSFKIGAEFRW